MDLSRRDLMFVGNLPLDTARQNMAVAGARLGSLTPGVPDGEVMDRRMWIAALAWRVFDSHPDIETLQRPRSVGGAERIQPQSPDEMWRFKVREGVERVAWAPTGWRLGYGKDAINSYAIFDGLKKQGIVPADARFQVSIPLADSAIDAFFHNPADWPKLKPGYQDAVAAEIKKMLDYIPAEELLIQWDACMELVDVESPMPWAPQDGDGAFARHVAPAAAVSAAVPEPVGLGYHLCYGIFPKWPMGQLYQDMSRLVRLANAFVAATPRKLDYLHVPIPPNATADYVAPLAGLKLNGAKLYCGVIHGHSANARDQLQRRIELVRPVVPKDFGVGRYCGFGGVPAAEFEAMLDDHLLARDLLLSGR